MFWSIVLIWTPAITPSCAATIRAAGKPATRISGRSIVAPTTGIAIAATRPQVRIPRIPAPTRQIDPPPAQRTRQHVIDVAVAPRSEQARRAVGVADRHQRLPDQPG